MRKIDLLIIHCSDSDQAAHDNIKTIDAWHKERGFKSPSGIHVGYHYFIDKSGVLHEGRPLEEVGAHAKGYNSNSIGVCLSGRYQFYRGQLNRLKALIIKLREKYGDFEIIGHNAVNDKKTCPNFPWQSFVTSLPPYGGLNQPKAVKSPQKEADKPQGEDKPQEKPQEKTKTKPGSKKPQAKKAKK